MKTGKTHFMALDGLRGVAALLVVVFHRRWWIGPGAIGHGYLAVDFFFMLSGFVIGYAYEGKLCRDELSFARFVRLRAERLGPLIALGALLGVGVLAVDAATKHWLGGVLRAIAALPLAVLTLPVPWLSPPFAINQPSWSLFYEILANLAFAMIAPRLSNRRLVFLLGFATAGLVTVVLIRQDIFIGWAWATLLPGALRVIVPFLAGIGLHRLWAADRLPGLSVPFWLLALVLALLLVLPPFAKPFDALYVLACILLVFPALIALGSSCRPTGPWQRIAALSAELSFPIYILHYPMLDAFDLARQGSSLHGWRTLLIEVGVIAVASLIISRYFDVPARQRLAILRQRTDRSVDHGAVPGGVPTNFQART
jgi:peptidoglycan/LPS O-acetylase OafA/YrhL